MQYRCIPFTNIMIQIDLIPLKRPIRDPFFAMIIYSLLYVAVIIYKSGQDEDYSRQKPVILRYYSHTVKSLKEFMILGHKASTLQAQCGDPKQLATPKNMSKRALALEFQQIKREIQQFEDKNEAAIHRIRQTYNFRKKQPSNHEFSQFSRSKEQKSHEYSVNGQQTPDQHEICVRTSDKEVSRQRTSVKDIVKEEDGLKLSLSKKPLPTILISKTRQDLNHDISKDNQNQHQMQRYSINQRHFTIKQPEKRRYSEAETRECNNNIVQDTLTSKSEEIYEEDQYACLSLKEPSRIDPATYSDLQSAFYDLRLRFNRLVLQHQALTEFIARQQKQQSHLPNENAQIKFFTRGIKKMLQDMFFSINEEYFGDKLFSVLGYVRKLQTKVKRLSFLVQNLREETKENRSLQSLDKSYTSNSQQLAQKARGKSLHANHLGPQVVSQYKDRVKRLEKDLIQSQHEIQSQRQLTQAKEKQRQQQIALLEKKILQITQRSQQQLKRSGQSFEAQRQFFKQKVNSLNLQLNEVKLANDKVTKELAKSNEIGKRSEAKLHQLYQTNDLERQHFKVQYEKLSQKYEQLMEQAEESSKNLQDARKVLMEKQVQLYSVSSKLRTLQSQLLFKEQKLTALDQLLLKGDTDHPLSQEENRQFRLETKNSIIKIELKDSNDSLQEQMSPWRKKQSLKRISNIPEEKEEYVRTLNEDESNELIAHNKALEEKLNRVNLEHQNYRQKYELLENQSVNLRRKYAQLFEKNRQDNKGYKQALKQLEQLHKIGDQRKEQFKQNQTGRCQLQLSQKKENINPEQKLQEYSELEDLENEFELMQFDQRMCHQERKPQNQNEQKIKQKDDQIQMYLQEIEELNEELAEMREEIKAYKKDKYNSLEESHRINRCRMPNIEPRQDYGYRQSLSFRLSVDPTDVLNTALGESQNLTCVKKQDDILVDKIKQNKNSRKDHITLFQKTTAYIKELKGIILEKSSKISQLQDELRKLRTANNFQCLSERQNIDKCELKSDCESIYDDNALQKDRQQDIYRSASVNASSSISNCCYRKRQGSNERNAFLIEENKILLQEIQILQEELSRSEEHEASLMIIKDYYKEQAKKLEDFFSKKLEARQQEIQKYKAIECSEDAIKRLITGLSEAFCGFASGNQQEMGPFASATSKLSEIKGCIEQLYVKLKISDQIIVNKSVKVVQ